MSTRIGDLETNYSARGNVSYQIELWHDGLKRHRLIRGAEYDVVYLAASQWRLDNTMESWKELEFHVTREHS